MEWQRRLAITLGAATIVVLAATAALLIWRRAATAAATGLYTCSRQFADQVPPDERIVVRGGVKTDELGHPVTWNAPMVFAWMDRKGFNYRAEDLSARTLDGLAARGGRYWIASPEDRWSALDTSRYRLLAHCGDEYALFDLRPDAPPEPRLQERRG
jgi:hypothetical protein